MTRVGILHTVPALAGDFDARLRAAIPGVDVVHLAQADLLTRAVAGDPAVPRMVLDAIDALVDMRCAAILVTCSSIGEAAEEAGAQVPVPVLRLDAPMAAEAARIAGDAAAERAEAGVGEPGHVVVLATQPSTIGPSTRLVEQHVARRGSTSVQVETVLVEGAADARAAGDFETHDGLLRDAIRSAAVRADAVVLAQASMAALASGAGDDADVLVPVLESVTSGVAAFARLVG